MPVIQITPNVTLRLGPKSPDTPSSCDTCQLTDKSHIKIIIPSLQLF